MPVEPTVYHKGLLDHFEGPDRELERLGVSIRTKRWIRRTTGHEIIYCFQAQGFIYYRYVGDKPPTLVNRCHLVQWASLFKLKDEEILC